MLRPSQRSPQWGAQSQHSQRSSQPSSEISEFTQSLKLPQALAVIPGIRELAYNFFAVQLGTNPVTGRPFGFFREWQLSFLSKDVDSRTGCILQLPPGAGKTVIAQWVMLEHLLLNPEDKIVFGAPLRTLAKQTADDVARTLRMFDQWLAKHQPAAGQAARHTVTLAEGPGARIDLTRHTVAVATYEHAAGELRRPPEGYHVGLVIVDEIHNIAKGDRGMVIDDLLYFSQLRTRCGDKCRVLGMSGTLQDWMSQRLLNSYTQGRTFLFNKVYKPEDLGIASEKAGLKAKRLYLDAKKFGFKETCYLARAITRDLLAQRLGKEPTKQDKGNAPDGWRRAVFFFSTVAEAEAACVFVATDPDIAIALGQLRRAQQDRVEKGLLTAPRAQGDPNSVEEGEYYAHPQLRMVNTLDKLYSKLLPEAQVKAAEAAGAKLNKHDAGTKLLDSLQASGIYLHHAQLKGQLGTAQQKSWQDILQEQLGDPSRDFVAVFCTSTLSVGVNLNSTQIGVLGPNTQWTIDQAEQMIGRVGRVAKHAANSVVYVVESSKYTAPGCESLAAPSAWFVPRLVAAIEFANKFPVLQESKDNLDIRGFFRPVNSPLPHTPDKPGGKATKVAESWKLISRGSIQPTTQQALAICRQDLKSLPCTTYLLTLNRQSEITPWVVCLWGLLVLRLPSKWNSPEATQNTVFNFDDPKFSPPVLKESEVVTSLIKLYGESHRLYPGDRNVPGSAESVRLCVLFVNRFAWCCSLYTNTWPYGDNVELFQLVHNLRELMSSCVEDASLLRAALDNSDETRTIGSLRRLEQSFEQLEGFLLVVENSLAYAATQSRARSVPSSQVEEQSSQQSGTQGDPDGEEEQDEQRSSQQRLADLVARLAQCDPNGEAQSSQSRVENIPAVSQGLIDQSKINEVLYNNWLRGLQEAAKALGARR